MNINKKLIEELEKIYNMKQEEVFLSEDAGRVIDRIIQIKKIENKDEDSTTILEYEKIKEYKNGSLIKITLIVDVENDVEKIEIGLWRTKSNKYLPVYQKLPYIDIEVFKLDGDIVKDFNAVELKDSVFYVNMFFKNLKEMESFKSYLNV